MLDNKQAQITANTHVQVFELIYGDSDKLEDILDSVL